MKKTNESSDANLSPIVRTLKRYKVTYLIGHALRKSAEVSIYGMRVRGSKVKHYPELRRAKKQYKREMKKLIIERAPEKKLAIVIHLYYTETWKELERRLQRLDSSIFDIFITLPSHNKDFREIITTHFPRAYILEVPNRGRDVLPFVRVIRALDEAGYEYVLKLHSKKSIHRVDGGDWLDDMVESLIPRSTSIQRDIIKTLQKNNTAIIGPQGHYVSMKVNYKPNKGGVKHVLHQIYSHEVQNRILKNYWRYGFFAGTMFWARLDALMPIVDKWDKVGEFARESGQIDATLAHALERCFSLVPEVEKKHIYQVGDKGLQEIPYLTQNIPDWSKVQKN